MKDIKVFYELTEGSKTWECETVCTCETVQEAIEFTKSELEDEEIEGKVLESKTIERFELDFLLYEEVI